MFRSNLSGFTWTLTAAGAFFLPFVLIGCSDQASNKTSNPTVSKAPSLSTSSTTQVASAEQNAIAQPATGFLTAIIQGRQQDAKQWLTPTAKQQVEENKNLLNPLGFQVEKLELGRVVSISSDDAAVEFMIVETGGTSSEEVCCLMKRHPAGWGVAGIACQAGPGEAPSVISFEHGRRAKVSQPKQKPMADQYVDNPAVSEEFRTANESAPTVR